MNPNATHRLLEDTLGSAALADSLHATRRAARRRRLRRQTQRTVAAACAILAAGWFVGRRTWSPGSKTASGASGSATSAATPPLPASPAFVLVTTAPSGHGVGMVRTSTPLAGLIVSTHVQPGLTPRVSENEVFALAGSRPAALHRLADGTARWMWLDEPPAR